MTAEPWDPKFHIGCTGENKKKRFSIDGNVYKMP
jgi:hypothetical protein